jgi:tryptophanyl-tRNA synthetase
MDSKRIRLEQSATFNEAKKRSDIVWDDLQNNNYSKYRLLTGDRPTGALHIGHYFGTLANRVKLQNMGVETFIVIADYQVLTDRQSSCEIRDNVTEVILDYLSVGLKPFSEKTVIFCHSQIPELNQLLLPFLSLVSIQELERNPTVKDEIKSAALKSINASMLMYPVHQAADILFCKGNIVPVGKDQLPHLEICQKIARRFNERYAKDNPIFPVPTALLSKVPHILGLDGSAKMSKSLGNGIMLKWSADETAKAIKKAKTDNDRNISYDPNKRPEIANLLKVLSLCTDRSEELWAEEIASGGSGKLKKVLTEAINEYFAPIRKRRQELAKEKDIVAKVLNKGCDRARDEARKTLKEVVAAMGMSYC